MRHQLNFLAPVGARRLGTLLRRLTTPRDGAQKVPQHLFLKVRSHPAVLRLPPEKQGVEIQTGALLDE